VQRCGGSNDRGMGEEEVRNLRLLGYLYCPSRLRSGSTFTSFAATSRVR